MAYKISISTSWEVGDDQREHARIIAGLDEATAAYEAAIKQVSGQIVIMKLAANRLPKVKDAPAPQILLPPDDGLTFSRNRDAAE